MTLHPLQDSHADTGHCVVSIDVALHLSQNDETAYLSPRTVPGDLARHTSSAFEIYYPLIDRGLSKASKLGKKRTSWDER